MAIHTTYSKARANLAKLCDEVAKNQEIVLINRRNAAQVALISSSELTSLVETAHLLRSPKNATKSSNGFVIAPWIVRRSLKKSMS